MKAYRGNREKAPLILNPGTKWRWVVNCMFQLLHLWGKNPSTPWTGRWVGSGASLDIEENYWRTRMSQLLQ